ncbi:hypothetical protein [Lacticaseibacillus parakribbianus]|uniref:hypothetical protein n=1 Tax=Lacticaseibacillus parakribbianus TaxID=2970927 RepID=UPI0021CB1ABB|nr:hypothetical protein [Lacticaseibacillus parakribbianus]
MTEFDHDYWRLREKTRTRLVRPGVPWAYPLPAGAVFRLLDQEAPAGTLLIAAKGWRPRLRLAELDFLQQAEPVSAQEFAAAPARYHRYWEQLAPVHTGGHAKLHPGDLLEVLGQAPDASGGVMVQQNGRRRLRLSAQALAAAARPLSAAQWERRRRGR